MRPGEGYDEIKARILSGDLDPEERENITALVDAALFYRTWIRALAIMTSMNEFGLGPKEADWEKLTEAEEILDRQVDIFMGKEANAEEEQVGPQQAPAQQGEQEAEIVAPPGTLDVADLPEAEAEPAEDSG